MDYEILMNGNVKIGTYAPDFEAITTMGKIKLNDYKGKWIEKKDILYMPTFHPAALLRDESKKIDFWNDLELVIEKYNELRDNNKI